ncbi:MAG TPA: molybdopterin-dependent oxidoreductase [Rhodocyclaceae bacterium]|nr:molybdopterin-dependent oxidoreductase [Rhodocyclaceae bacterium]
MKLYAMRKATTGLLSAATVILSAAHASAADETVLAQKSGCLACHAGVAKKIGPPYAAVAEKYAGRKDAEALLAEHILKGTGPDGLGWAKEDKASLPFMPPNANVTPKDAARLAKWILGVKGEIVDFSKFVTDSVSIGGAVEHPLRLTVADLRKLAPRQAGDVPLVCETGANMGKIENLRGVLLRDILEKAKVVAPGHNDVKKMIIIATASDDYKVVFSWTEVFNSPVGEGVIVFFERDGRPLADDEGHIAMISTKDLRTGPRHVKWLSGIEVRKIAD